MSKRQKYHLKWKPVRISLDQKYAKLKIEMIDNVPHITGPKTQENLNALNFHKDFISIAKKTLEDQKISQMQIERCKVLKEERLGREGGELGAYLATLLTIKKKWF